MPASGDSINFHGNNLSTIDADLFSRVAFKMTSLDVSHTQIPSQVINKLLLQLIRNSPCNTLKQLTLTGNNIEDLDPNTVAEAVSKLEKIDLSHTNLTSEQVTKVISTVVEFQMKEISLFNIKMDSVDPSLLEQAKDVALINYNFKNT